MAATPLLEFEVTFHEEKSDHDGGYCSESECEFTQRVYIKTITFAAQKDVPQTLQGFARFADPVTDHCDSGYCELSPECKTAQLEKHDSRITVIKVAKKTEGVEAT